MEIKIRTAEGVEIPKYETEGSAGFDLTAVSFQKLYSGNEEIDMKEKLAYSLANGYINLRAQERVLIGTGLYMEIPIGYELQIRPRSGKALKEGLMIANSPGTIDSDFRGEIGIIVLNSTPHLLKIKLGEKIAQGVLTNYEKAEFIEADLSETQRGANGFGHTSDSKVSIAIG